MTIIPKNQGKMIGKLTLSFKGAGKVKKGQQVNIKFSNYPYLEYGMVRGVVESISLVPEDQNYIVEVSLPDSLTTFYGKTLSFTQEMQGSAEIITEDKRLLEQILRPIKYVFTKNFAQAYPPVPEADTLEPEEERTIAKAGSSHITPPKSDSGPELNKSGQQPRQQYYLIGGSFRKKENAEDLQKRLLKKGYDDAEVLHETDGLHKVSYTTCRSLEKAQDELNKLGEKGVDSWIYQPPADH